MDKIIYRNLEIGDIENVLSFWAVLDGVHLHSNGEESVEGIRERRIKLVLSSKQIGSTLLADVMRDERALLERLEEEKENDPKLEKDYLKQKELVDKLIEKIHANKNILAHVNWNNINKFEFNGVIYAGNVSGR